MAYLDLAFDLPRAALATGPITPRHDVVHHVAPIECEVIRIARSDSRWSLRAPGRVGRALAWLFGWKPTNRLADPHLESLRRYAVMFRLRGDRLPVEETTRLLAAGFTRGAINEIRRLIPAGSVA